MRLRMARKAYLCSRTYLGAWEGASAQFSTVVVVVWMGYYPFISPLCQGVLLRYILGASPPSKSQTEQNPNKKISMAMLVLIFFADSNFCTHIITYFL